MQIAFFAVGWMLAILSQEVCAQTEAPVNGSLASAVPIEFVGASEAPFNGTITGTLPVGLFESPPPMNGTTGTALPSLFVGATEGPVGTGVPEGTEGPVGSEGPMGTEGPIVTEDPTGETEGPFIDVGTEMPSNVMAVGGTEMPNVIRGTYIPGDNVLCHIETRTRKRSKGYGAMYKISGSKDSSKGGSYGRRLRVRKTSGQIDVYPSETMYPTDYSWKCEEFYGISKGSSSKGFKGFSSKGSKGSSSKGSKGSSSNAPSKTSSKSSKGKGGYAPGTAVPYNEAPEIPVVPQTGASQDAPEVHPVVYTGVTQVIYTNSKTGKGSSKGSKSSSNIYVHHPPPPPPVPVAHPVPPPLSVVTAVPVTHVYVHHSIKGSKGQKGGIRNLATKDSKRKRRQF